VGTIVVMRCRDRIKYPIANVTKPTIISTSTNRRQQERFGVKSGIFSAPHLLHSVTPSPPFGIEKYLDIGQDNNENDYYGL
jgi:hypothetical protein